MLLSKKTVAFSSAYKKAKKSIVLHESEIQSINNRISESIQKNESFREKGLEVASKCRMR